VSIADRPPTTYTDLASSKEREDLLAIEHRTRVLMEYRVLITLICLPVCKLTVKNYTLLLKLSHNYCNGDGRPRNLPTGPAPASAAIYSKFEERYQHARVPLPTCQDRAKSTQRGGPFFPFLFCILWRQFEAFGFFGRCKGTICGRLRFFGRFRKRISMKEE
jgi:hypothetical protein